VAVVTATDDWRVGYKRAVLTAFARKAAVRGNANYYDQGGGLDYDRTTAVYAHLRACTVDPVLTAMPTDSSWDEFMGTFYEGDETRHGMDATVTCKCGTLRTVPMRLTGTFSELLQAVLEED
jgi:hypothetical protein